MFKELKWTLHDGSWREKLPESLGKKRSFLAIFGQTCFEMFHRSEEKVELELELPE